MPLAEHEVEAALDKIAEMFPTAAPSSRGGQAAGGAPVAGGVASVMGGERRGRARVDSAARPAEFYRPGKYVPNKNSAAEKNRWDSISTHGINEPALRQRLESKAIDQATVDRIQLDFLTHDKLSPDDMSKLHDLVQQAHAMHSNHDDTGAELIYSQVLEADPLDFECLTNLGKITYSKGDLVRARDLFERAVVVRPEREKTMYHLARVLFDQKEFERAKILFEQVVQGYKNEGEIIGDSCDKPTYHNSIAMLGLIHQNVLNNLEKALQLYKVVLTTDPDHVLTLDHKCSLLTQAGKPDEAAKLHKKVCNLDPNHTKKACPYLDSLFPEKTGLMHPVLNVNDRIEMFSEQFCQGARKKSWTNHPIRSLKKKVTRLLGGQKPEPQRRAV